MADQEVGGAARGAAPAVAAGGDRGEAALAGGRHGGARAAGRHGGARAAADGGLRRGAPALDGTRRALADGNKKLWIEGNSNRKIEDKKIISTGSPFKSDYSLIKQNNARLKKLYDELEAIQELLRDTSSTDVLQEQQKLLDEVTSIQRDIKSVKGFALPLPNKLKKRLKVLLK